MVRVTFEERQQVSEKVPPYFPCATVQEHRYEFETSAYRILATADDPTEYDESVITIRVGEQLMHLAIKVEATHL